MKAQKLDDVYDNFLQKPLAMDRFEELFVNTDKGRGGLPAYHSLQRHLVKAPSGSLNFLFAGHRGCGKSAELTRLQRDIQDQFVVINFSIFEELDIQNINYIELFIVTMEKLFAFIEREKRISIDDQYLEVIQNWLQTREIKQINDKHLGINLESGLKVGVNIPFLAKFFGKFKSAAKSSVTVKETLTKLIEPRLSELIDNCNRLIVEIKTKLPRINKQGLVIIFEDMDKLDIQKGEDIFFNHSKQLKLLKCHTIFTFPLPLLYHIKFRPIKNNFDGTFILPMIKVSEKNGLPFEDGIDAMRAIVRQRMELSLFGNSDILTQMIRTSGGCLIDLFLFIREAAENAFYFERPIITPDDYQAALNHLKNDYYFTIAENREKGFKVEDYYDALKTCAQSDSKEPNTSDIMLDLRYNLSVLSYNGTNWEDVHPVVKMILNEKGMLSDSTLVT
jgi:hypothetical protein